MLGNSIRTSLAARRRPGLAIEGGKTMSNQRFESVWDTIEDTPEQAATMKRLPLFE